MRLNKGDRVRITWTETQFPAHLAGIQPKAVVSWRSVEGVVTHVRGDHPTAPTTVAVWVKGDGGDEVGPVDVRSISTCEPVGPGTE